MQKFSFLLVLAWSCAILTLNLTNDAQAEEVHTYGPIKSGDMLWGIAAKVSPPSVSRHQVILALHKTNPQAFSVPCNMNSLKVGEILRIPSLTEMQTFTRAEAIKEFDRQNEEWRNRRKKTIVCPPLTPATEPAKSSTESISSDATAPTKATPAEIPTTSALATVPLASQETPETPTISKETPPVPTTEKAASDSIATVEKPSVKTSTELGSSATQLPSNPPIEKPKPLEQPNQPNIALAPKIEPTDSRVETPPVSSELAPETEPTDSRVETPLVSSEKIDPTVETPPVPPTTAIDTAHVTTYLPQSWSSSMQIALFTIVGVILGLFIMGLWKRPTKKVTVDPKTPETYIFSEPIDEMPLQINTPEKSSTNHSQ